MVPYKFTKAVSKRKKTTTDLTEHIMKHQAGLVLFQASKSKRTLVLGHFPGRYKSA